MHASSRTPTRTTLDEAWSILSRARGALDVVALFLMHEAEAAAQAAAKEGPA